MMPLAKDEVARLGAPGRTEMVGKRGAKLVGQAGRFDVGFLQGAQIDWEESLEGATFVVKNPNATASCGCGTSFSIG